MSNQLDKSSVENTTAPKVGLIGFVCHDGEKRTFDFCTKKCDKHGKDCPYPFPLLLALMKDRKVVPNSYAVTEILNPPQVVYFSRNKPYYATPESLIWMTFGSAWHNLIEFQKDNIKDLGLEKEYLIEEAFEVEIGGIKMRGRSDMYCVSTKTLWDFKTMKKYGVQKAWKNDWTGSTYPMQMNIYRVYQYPEAEKIMISAIIKDHAEYMVEKLGMQPIERLEVPVIPDLEVTETVKELLTMHIENQADPSKIRQCRDNELFINRKGERVRCLKYCPVSEECEQYNEHKRTQHKAKK